MSSESENQFVEVMSLITHMYKQTAVAKVKCVCAKSSRYLILISRRPNCLKWL